MPRFKHTHDVIYKAYEFANFHLGLSAVVIRCLILVTAVQVSLLAGSTRATSGLLSNSLFTFQVHSCEGEVLVIRCPKQTTISIQFAQYGRQVPSHQMCPGSALLRSSQMYGIEVEDISCLAVTSLQVLLDICQDRQYCRLAASSETFTQDPCPGTGKYLEVTYKCRPNEFHTKTVCEGEALELWCKRPLRLVIYTSMFGRTPSGNAKCPAYGDEEIDCQSITSQEEVMRRCHGRRECKVDANVRTFGEPCTFGTNKYLTVIYTCVPKRILKAVRQERPSSVAVSPGSLLGIAESAEDALLPSRDINRPRHSNHRDLEDEAGNNNASSGKKKRRKNRRKKKKKHKKKKNNKHKLIPFPDDPLYTTTQRIRTKHPHRHKKPKLTTTTTTTTTTTELPVVRPVETTSAIIDNNYINNKNKNQIKNTTNNLLTTSIVFKSISTPSVRTTSVRTFVPVKTPSVDDNVEAKVTTQHPWGIFTRKRSTTTTVPVINTLYEHAKEDRSVPPAYGGPASNSQDVKYDHTVDVDGKNWSVHCENTTAYTTAILNTNVVGFLSDWMTVIHFIHKYREKAVLYMVVGALTGAILLLFLVIAKLLIDRKRKIRAKLDISEPIPQTPNRSNVDASTLERSDSTADVIEVVRFSPRGTLRSERGGPISLHNDSGTRSLNNYYYG